MRSTAKSSWDNPGKPRARCWRPSIHGHPASLDRGGPPFDPALDELGEIFRRGAGLAPSLTSTILSFRRSRRFSRHILRDSRIGAAISQKSDFGDARVSPCNHHGLGLFAWGPKHLLAVNLVTGDCLLAFVRNEPVDELLAKLLLHMGMLGRVNQDDTVLVEQQFVPLHHDDEVLPEIDFRNMRAGVVAARDEGCTLGLNGLQRKGDVPCPLDAGGIVLL